MKNVIGLISADYTSDDFGSLTNGRTLATIPYGGRYRLLDFCLSSMVNSGISTVGILAPYTYRSLLDHVGVGKPWSLGRKSGGLFILPGSVYGVRSKSSRFLVRDIKLNSLFLQKDDADYVLFCDSNRVYNLDFRPMIEAHSKSSCPITLGYKKVDDASQHTGSFLSIDGNGLVTDFNAEAKGEANYYVGCMLIDRSFLLQCLEWFGVLESMGILEVLMANLSKVRINTYAFEGYIGSIDTIGDYLKVSMDMLDWCTRTSLFYGERKIFTKVQDEAPALYSSDACVKNSLISSGCIIEGTVENSIIFRNCIVKKGAVVKNSIIMRKSLIEEGANLDHIICDKYVHFNKGISIVGSAEKPIILGKNQQI